MRKLTTLFVALMLSVIAFAAEPQTVYCTITSYPTGSLDGREWVKISYGQEDDSRNWLVDENGKKRSYSTIIQVANHLSKYGWRVVEALREPMTLILQKEITSPEEITEGFMTRQMYVEEKGESSEQ